MTQTLDIVGLVALFTLVSTLLMQVVKPLVELIPGINAPANQAAHDGALRLLLGAINFGFLLLAARSLPSAFVGLQWWDLLALALNQSVLSHATYRITTAGKVDTGAGVMASTGAGAAFTPFRRSSAPEGTTDTVTPIDPSRVDADAPVDVPIVPR